VHAKELREDLDMVPRRHVILASLLACIALVSACGGSTATTGAVAAPAASAASAPLATVAPVASGAPAAAAASGMTPPAVQCPSLAVVGAAVSAAPYGTNPAPKITTSSTPVGAETICDYSDIFQMQLEVQFITVPSPAYQAAAKSLHVGNASWTAVPGLGDAAYYNTDLHALLVFYGQVSAIQILSSSGDASEGQMEGLARTLIGK
jgi:hypothetical protein